MQRDKLLKYLSSKYAAAKGGAVPVQDQDEDENLVSQEAENEDPEEINVAEDMDPVAQSVDEEESTEEPDEAIVAQNTPAETKANSSSKFDAKALQQALQAKFDKASDNSAVAQAQDQQNASNRFLNVAEPLEGAIRANGINGGIAVNHQAYQNTRNQNAEETKQAELNRDKSIQGFLQKQAIDQQVVKRQIDEGTIEQKKQAIAYFQAAHTPGSQISLTAVNQFNTLYPEYALDPKTASLADVENMSKAVASKNIADIKKMGIELKAKQAEANAIAASSARDAKKEKADKDTATKDFIALGKDNDEALATSRNAIGTAVNKTNAAKRVLGFANVDTSEIEAAAKDPQKKAALITKLNNLNPQQAAEVTLGLMNTISSGSSSLGQFEHLKAPTANETLANLKQYFTAHPQAAGVGAILANNMESLNNEIKVNQKILDDHKNSLRKKHPFAFEHPDTAEKSEALFKAPENTEQAPATASPNTNVASEAKVKIQAPDGSINEVPASRVAYYLGKGGKVVQ